MTTAVMWFMRDLRLGDNPALLEAHAAGLGGVVPLFVLDDRLWRPQQSPRTAYLSRLLAELSERVGGLQVAHGDPVDEVVRVARTAGAWSVHAAGDVGPHGALRDRRVEQALRARHRLRNAPDPRAVGAR